MEWGGKGGEEGEGREWKESGRKRQNREGKVCTDGQSIPTV